MRPAEKNLQKQSPASLPSPGRRKFLRNLLAAAALAPLSCSREKDAPAQSRKSIFRNRELRLGDSAIILEECRDDGKIQSAKFRILHEGKAFPDSVSMLVPGHLSVSSFQPSVPGYEIMVESISCGELPSASLAITKKQQEEAPSAAASDLLVPGSAIAFAASLVLWAVQRRNEAAEKEPIILSPKRPEPSEPL